MKKLKRAFTIVELVIVIAVIAILAAVLIPTFSNIIRKANVSSDTQLVRNLNTALVVDRTVNGEHKTMHSALQAAFDAGYDIDKINARANQNEILWDSVNDVFCYYDVDQGIIYTPDVVNRINEVANYQYWKIVNTNDEEFQTTPNSYSIYAGSNFQAKTIVLNEVGFDAGNNSNINVVNYFNNSEGREVVIRTNSASTTLTINDSSTGTITHYDSLGALNIIQCHTASYHENGKVAYAEIAKGRIVLENGSKVEEIHVNKLTESSFDTVIIANNGGTEELPSRITRDAVTVSTETLVVKVESNGSSENVYVYADGATGTKGSTQKITEGVNKQNEAVNSALGQLVLDNGSNPGEKAQTSDQKAEAKRDAINEALENTEFKGVAISKAGVATQLMTIEAFRDAVNADNTYEGYTVKLLDNINLENVEWTPLKLFKGTFDGNNKIISNLTVESNVNKANLGLFALTENAEIKNLTLSNFKIRDTGSSKSANSGALIGTAKNGLSLSRITVDSKTEVSGKKNGGIVGNVECSKACQYFFDRCDSSATITGERCGGIVGQINPANSGYNNDFGFDIFTSCSFDGVLNANTGSQPIAGGIVAQYTGGNPEYLTHGLYNCSVNNTNISSNLTKGSFIGFSQSGLSFFNCKLNDNDLTVPVPYLCGGRYVGQSFSINGIIYIIDGSTAFPNDDYPNLTAEYDEQYTCTVKANQQADKYYANGEQVSGEIQVWYKVTNLYVDMAGNAIFSSDASVVFKGSMPTSLEEGTKLQRRTYVAGYDYSARQYTYGFDMWRIVNDDVEAEGTGFGQWQDVDNDGSTRFVLGAGIYFNSDPTPFVDSNTYTVSARETASGHMIYTVTAK